MDCDVSCVDQITIHESRPLFSQKGTALSKTSTENTELVFGRFGKGFKEKLIN